ncbi:uncharacterized protein I303_107605 [Kwoniella dejecticola CBS 10117]|uniref:U3 small nucleolar RNA-associated protein 4 n=1 Tax=Kwoniella dejecticola CBS 10117 TaxID=1296121 RepID=A0A1A5ZV74_9TREE|nr:uncharacterized protein I303_07616 [Kwoniella dejecticola CBS 10117]OBR81706.1 hypothetical protein I303_07616 [Kwoniella dejecticola CBS 10117]
MPVPTTANIPASVPLHRIRFYDHTPSPITALSFAPLPLPPPRDPSSSKGKSRDALPANGQEEYGVLILARENGEVEIWEYVKGDENNMSGNWVLEKTLPPTLTHPTISSIALVIRDPLNFHRKSHPVPKVGDLRLFTAGSDSNEMTERCLLTGKILQTYDIPSPPLWSMSVAPTHDLLCLSTSSQSLHFLSIPAPTMFNPSPRLEPPPSHLLRCDTLPSRTRTVSIAWGIPKLVKSLEDEEEWEWQNRYLITGNSDSSFRKWELPPPLNPSKPSQSNRVTLKSRAVLEKVAKSAKGGKKNQGGSAKGTIVWGVGVLPDQNFVTSDSLGNVTFWDAQSMAQKQMFRAHKADGMCLTIGPGGRSVFTSGPDQRVCQFINVPSTSSSGSQWLLTSTKRVHSHDVRALSIFPPYVPAPLAVPINPHYAPVLASGGWDMSLILTPAASPDSTARNPLGKAKGANRAIFEESFSRKMGYLSGGRANDRIAFAPQARLMLGRKERGVGIWKVLEDEGGWEKCLEMELRLRTNLVSSNISPDGKWLAVSDLYETKLFHLSIQETTLRSVRVKSFWSTLISSPLLEGLSIPSKGCGSSSMLFTSDSQRLILGLVSSGQILVLELPQEPTGQVEVVKLFTREDKIVDGRVVKGKTQPKANGVLDGVHKDVDMEDRSEAEIESDKDEDEDEDDEEDEESTSEEDAVKQSRGKENGAWISCLGVSEDSQWLAVCDLQGRTGVWNLDTLQLHATLPTFPNSPISITFPPSSPLLLLALPNNSLQFYHLEHRKLLPPSGQILELHRHLSALHSPLAGITFLPSPTSTVTVTVAGTIPTIEGEKEKGRVKTLIWGMDWLITLKMDLESMKRSSSGSNSNSRRLSDASSLVGSVGEGINGIDSPVKQGMGMSGRALRKKRAREAKELRDSLGSTTTTPINGTTPSIGGSRGAKDHDIEGDGEQDGGIKVIKDKHKNILSVGSIGSSSEIGIVERPLVDYLGELPNAFWSGSYGRA